MNSSSVHLKVRTLALFHRPAAMVFGKNVHTTEYSSVETCGSGNCAVFSVFGSRFARTSSLNITNDDEKPLCGISFLVAATITLRGKRDKATKDDENHASIYCALGGSVPNLSYSTCQTASDVDDRIICICIQSSQQRKINFSSLLL